MLLNNSDAISKLRLMADVFLLYFCTLGIIYRVLGYCDHTLSATEREKETGGRMQTGVWESIMRNIRSKSILLV